MAKHHFKIFMCMTLPSWRHQSYFLTANVVQNFNPLYLKRCSTIFLSCSLITAAELMILFQKVSTNSSFVGRLSSTANTVCASRKISFTVVVRMW